MGWPHGVDRAYPTLTPHALRALTRRAALRQTPCRERPRAASLGEHSESWGETKQRGKNQHGAREGAEGHCVCTCM